MYDNSYVILGGQKTFKHICFAEIQNATSLTIKAEQQLIKYQQGEQIRPCAL